MEVVAREQRFYIGGPFDADDGGFSEGTLHLKSEGGETRVARVRWGTIDGAGWAGKGKGRSRRLRGILL